jgi:membrane-associated protease RseP (regulator of RpoE activity)
MDDTILGWFFFFFVVYATVFCFVGFYLGKYKGRAAEGFWWGFCLGFVGVIIVALLPATERKEAESRAALAEAISRSVSSYPTSPQTIRTNDERKEAMARAIEKDPSLGESDDPETLERLRQATDQILLDLETLRARQAIVDEKATAEAETARLETARLRAVERATVERDLFDSLVAENGNVPALGAVFVRSFTAGGVKVTRPKTIDQVVIFSGSPAARAGMQPGDVLLVINATRTKNTRAVDEFMTKSSKGDQLRLYVRRGSNKMVLEVDL